MPFVCLCKLSDDRTASIWTALECCYTAGIVACYVYLYCVLVWFYQHQPNSAKVLQLNNLCSCQSVAASNDLLREWTIRWSSRVSHRKRNYNTRPMGRKIYGSLSFPEVSPPPDRFCCRNVIRVKNGWCFRFVFWSWTPQRRARHSNRTKRETPVLKGTPRTLSPASTFFHKSDATVNSCYNLNIHRLTWTWQQNKNQISPY